MIISEICKIFKDEDVTFGEQRTQVRVVVFPRTENSGASCCAGFQLKLIGAGNSHTNLHLMNISCVFS